MRQPLPAERVRDNVTAYDFEEDSYLSEENLGLRGDVDSVPDMDSFDSPRQKRQRKQPNKKNVSFHHAVEENKMSTGRKGKKKDLRKQKETSSGGRQQSRRKKK